MGSWEATAQPPRLSVAQKKAYASDAWLSSVVGLYRTGRRTRGQNLATPDRAGLATDGVLQAENDLNDL
jgi:hypothetical protein